MGSLSSEPLKDMSNIKPKFFKRFPRTRDGHWYVGRDRWDAIAFKANHPVTVVGIGLYEGYRDAGGYEFGWKYIVEDENGTNITESEVMEGSTQGMEVEEHIIKYRFDKKQFVKLKAN